jgi:hypothetical protein
MYARHIGMNEKRCVLLALKVGRPKHQAYYLEYLRIAAWGQKPRLPASTASVLCGITHIWNFRVRFLGFERRFNFRKRLFDLFKKGR